jgi:general secretion pathway protein M
MTDDHRFSRYLTRHPWVAALCYFGVVLTLLLVNWVALADIYQRHAAIAAAGDLLDRLEGRKRPVGSVSAPTGVIPTGSPFLEGPTVTVAGAAILHRVASAVRQVGGDVLSSQVEVEGTPAKGGMVSVTMSCDLGQLQLQQLLYDLETGMPFLFVDQLVVQAPQGITTTEGGRLRLLLAVSGQWEDPK